MLRAVVSLSLALSAAGCQSNPFGSAAPFGMTSLEDVYVYTNEPAVVGRKQFERGNYGLSERYFREAVEKNALDADSFVGLAASYDNLKRFDLADRAYARAVEVGGWTAQIA